MGVTAFNDTAQTISLNIVKIVSCYILGFPCGSAGKESACNAEDPGSIPGLGRSLGEGNGYHEELDMTEGLTLAPFFIN